MENIYAFIDEFGNNSFDFENQGSHFIVAAVICKHENLKELTEKVEVIRKKFFQTGEIKSSGVGANHTRRKLILKEIAGLKFSIFSVVVDKRELNGKGFEIKKSFYKFLNNLVYKELFRTYPRIEINVDEHGGSDYLIEFQKYVHKHHESNLFSGSEFYIQNSKNNFLIQLADFIAGTLGYIFDELKKGPDSNEFFEIIEPRIAAVNIFPRKFSVDELVESNIDNSFDPKIARVCIQRINSFLENTKNTDSEANDQISFLNLLLLFQRANPKNRYINTHEIFDHLYRNNERKISEEYFRSKVVGRLRDQGILIASSRYGYKIPSSASDLNTFISHGKRIILPMLNRIKQAREGIKLATGNDLDLLMLPEYSQLRKILEL